MKRKLLICSSLITLLLSVFSVPIFAEETVQDSSTLHSLSDGVFLDQYFYNNFDLLPYLESSGYQYIDSGIKASSHLKIDVTFSDLKPAIETSVNIFGSTGDSDSPNRYSLAYRYLNGNYFMWFYSSYYNYPFVVDPYVLTNVVYDKNKVYVNSNLINTFNNVDFDSTYNIFIFAESLRGSASGKSNCKIYKLSIYDYSLNNNEGGYVRYYYPAKSKVSGTLGLYDAVNKTFITTGGNVQFVNPTNEYVENFQISSFLSNSLTWIGQIFDAIIQIPIIIIFIAIGLAGAMFRWGRRIVHF